MRNEFTFAIDPTCFTFPNLAPSFTLRFWATALLADGAGLETLNLISHLVIVIKNNTHCFEKGATFSLLLEETERIREVVEVGRREEEVELFKASLNGEGEVFLGSLEYMVVVMVSADAVQSPKANIYIAQYIGACQPSPPAMPPLPPDRLLSLGCAQARQTTRLMILTFCRKE